MKTSTLFGIAIALVVIVGGAWLLLMQGSNNSTNTNVTVQPGTDSTGDASQTGSVSGSDVQTDTSGQGTGTGVTGDITGTVTTGSGAAMTATVTYDGSNFSPSTVTIKKGGTVTFTNQSSSGMWVASGPHPAHTGYDGTSRTQHCPNSGTAFDQCATGNSYSFKFDKIGEWPYHNHNSASVIGKVVVVE